MSNKITNMTMNGKFNSDGVIKESWNKVKTYNFKCKSLPDDGF